MASVSRKQLIQLCHDLGNMLDAGLPITRALATLAGQQRGAWGRTLAETRRRIEEGNSLSEAFDAAGRFPALFIRLVEVGEESGTLERTLAELQRYYEFRRRIWRSFLGQIAYPVFEYLAAVAVIALVMWILAMLERPVLSPWFVLLVGYGAPVGLIIFYKLVVDALGATRPCHELLLALPVVGRVTQSLALARFSLVLHLEYESGIPLPSALESAFEATGNAAFMARGRRARRRLEEGGELTGALEATDLFPRDYLQILSVAEDSGKVGERLDWLAEHNADRTESALTALARVAGWVIWVGVAAFIAFFIFRLFLGYIGAIQQVAGR